MAQPPNSIFELNNEDLSHVGDPAHVSVVNSRRVRLQQWLNGLHQLPKPSHFFQQMICYNGRVRSDLTKATEKLKQYVSRKTIRRPFNIFLAAPPGGGKSSLVRSLCSSLNIPKLSKLIEINFSNLLSVDNAIPVFERLSLLKHNDLLPVVFFDEVDAPAWAVYQFMLMPMWDGACIVRGMPVEFGKAIFFFAGSRQQKSNGPKYVVYPSSAHWVQNATRKLEDQFSGPDSGKEPDFYSRIDLTLHLTPAHCHFQDEWDANSGPYWQDEETVMIAAEMIRRHFPETRIVDSRVLLFLAGALPHSRRDLDRILFLSSMNETDVEFTWNHLPSETLSGGPWYDYVNGRASQPIELT